MGSQKERGAGEDLADKIRGQQHTGNHDHPAGEDPDRFAGTRAGAENVEPAKPGTRKKGG
jgi:hypothetical protein